MNRKIGQKCRDTTGLWWEVISISERTGPVAKSIDAPAVHAVFEIHGNTVVVHSMWCRDDLRGAGLLGESGRCSIFSLECPRIVVPRNKTFTLYTPGRVRHFDGDAVLFDCTGNSITPQELVDSLQSLIGEINVKYEKPEAKEVERRTLPDAVVAQSNDGKSFGVELRASYAKEETAIIEKDLLNSIIAKYNEDVEAENAKMKANKNPLSKFTLCEEKEWMEADEQQE